MIENFLSLMGVCMDFMKTEFTFGSITFSMWDVFMLSIVFSAVAILIRGVYRD